MTPTDEKPMTVDALEAIAREVGQVERRHCIGKAQGFDVRDAYSELRAAIDLYGKEQYARGVNDVWPAGSGSGEPVAWTGTVVNNVRGKPVDPAACVEWAKNYWWSDDGPVMTIVLLAWREAVMRCDRSPLTDEQIWTSDEIMAINARAGLQMPTLMELVRAIDNIRSEG